MNHFDLLEDVVLGLVVAWTTVAALYVGWRTGRAARRRAAAAGEGDPAVPDGLEPVHDAAPVLPVPISDWSRRLAAEEARCIRHGSSAAVVAIRMSGRQEPPGRRAEAAVQASERAAEALARRARASDSICVTPDGIIRTLLIESTESGASRFVDRISAELADAPGVDGKDIVAAWAAMAPGRDLRAADRLAVARLRGATSGWLRSLAVHRTADLTPDGADLGGGSPDRHVSDR